MSGKHVLVIGRFDPPHAGHEFLFGKAMKLGERCSIVVCGRADESIPLSVRAGWITSWYPQAHVIPLENPGFGDDQQKWAELIVNALGGVPDLLCTSEAYGEEYARTLGCAHVLVDAKRGQVPISARAIKEDYEVNARFLRPEVLAYLREHYPEGRVS